jgi:hypothetical protein
MSKSWNIWGLKSLSIYECRQTVLWPAWSVLAGLVFAFCLTAHAETLRLVIAGDDRADNEHNGFNEEIAREIARAVIGEKAEMLLWTGDLVNALKGDAATFERELLSWRETMTSLYDHNVQVLAVRGNHEIVGYDPCDPKHAEQETPHAEDIWRKVFSGPYGLPANGPAGEKDLSFFVVRDSVLVIGLDQYTHRHSVNQEWLDEVLSEHKRDFIVVYGHEPAFMAGNHKDEDILAAEQSKRNMMWESLIRAGARVYFCGHDHFYDHMKVLRANGDPRSEMHQFTAGTAGAPYYKGSDYIGNNTGWNVKPVRHIDYTYGYILMVIQEKRATVTFKGRISKDNYAVMDAWSYDASSP